MFHVTSPWRHRVPEWLLWSILLLIPGRGLAQVRIMSLGNSITQGDIRHNTYRRPLWQKLQAGGYNVDFVGSLSLNNGGPNPTPDFDLDHEGHWGWRADELTVNARTWAVATRPNVVLLHAGSNDIDQGQTVTSTRDDLSSLIDQLRLGQPTVTVLLAQLIPTSNATNNANYTTLNALLPALAQLKSTAQSPIIIVDQYTGFSAATETSDGVHPNALGEEKMATRWYAALQAVLSPSPTGDFTLTVVTAGSGMVAKTPNQLSYLSGTNVTLTATPAAGFAFSGWSGDATGNTNPLSVAMTANKTITATFTALPIVTQQVISYTLVNTDTNGDILNLTTGTTLNLATLPTRHLNIRANTNPATVGSLVFGLSGTVTRSQTENVIPYALYSDNQGAYYSWTPLEGSYSLTARPYTGGSGSGTAGTALPISFSVIDQAPGPFTLALNTLGSGSATKSPNQTTYPSGTSVTLTPSPAAGFQFAGWSGDATGTANPLTVVMASDKIITATFTALATDYTITLNTVGSGAVARSPDQATYPSGSSVTLTATPAAGLAFSGWSGDATGNTNPLSVVMTANKTITATFAAIVVGQQVASFTLVNADTDLDLQLLTNGAVLNLATLPTRNLNIRANTSPIPVGSVVFALSGVTNRTQTESVLPYALFGDNGLGDYSPWVPALGNYTLTARPYTGGSGSGTAGTALALSFSVVDQATGPFTLTVNTVGSGSVSKSPDQATYPAGSIVTLTATPAAGFTFAGWNGVATGTTNPLVLGMTTNTNVTATFTAIPVSYALAVSAVGTGSVAKSPDQVTYVSGSSVTLTATAAAGFAFSGWSGDATGSTNPLSVPMTADKNITATFIVVVPVEYTLAVSSVGNGTVSASPDQATYVSGTSITLTPTPAAGFQFAGWSGDATGITNPLTVVLNANKTITATFTALAADYTLTTTTTGSGTIGRSSDQTTYASGSTVTLTATPAAGFQFAGWDGDATGTVNPLDVAMTIDKTITANFAALPPSFTLAVSTVGAGTVAKNPDQVTYVSGTSVTLTAAPAAGFQFTGWSGAATGTANPLAMSMTADKTLTATFTALVVGPQVSSFTLVNADTDLDIQPLTDGAVLNLATLPTRNLNIRANTSPPTVGSVRMVLSGTAARTQTESVVPYALFGDNGLGDYSPWVPALGNYTLTGRPYSGGGGAGTAGTALTIAFSVQNQLAKPAALATSATTASLRAVAYPNPSPDNRYVVTLPQPLEGRVKYVLRSELGTVVAAGEVQLNRPATALPFDFSRQIQSAGVYYLLLENQRRVMRVQLLTN